MKEYRVIQNEYNIDTIGMILTNLSKQGWIVEQFTDHLTLLSREIKEEEILTEG